MHFSIPWLVSATTNKRSSTKYRFKGSCVYGCIWNANSSLMSKYSWSFFFWTAARLDTVWLFAEVTQVHSLSCYAWSSTCLVLGVGGTKIQLWQTVTEYQVLPLKFSEWKGWNTSLKNASATPAEGRAKAKDQFSSESRSLCKGVHQLCTCGTRIICAMVFCSLLVYGYIYWRVENT